MKKSLFTILLVSLTIALFAQAPPDTLWTKTYGGIDGECAYSVQQTIDEGYIITGYTESYGAGGADFWLVKTDENGNEEWNQTYGGINNDHARSVQQTIDGGYIIAGFTCSFGTSPGVSNFWLVKTDENGNEEWNQTYGGSSYDKAFSVQQTTDGGYILGGNTESYGAGEADFWLVKTDENGNEEWNHTYGEINDDSAYSVQQTSDGGYVVAGITLSFVAGFSDFWLVKTDGNGNEEWNQTYGGNYYEGARSVQQTIDGGYIIAGFTGSFGTNPGVSDFCLVKTDEDGNQEWLRFWGSSPGREGAYSVQQTIDEGYIITGYTESYGAGGADFWLVKTDENGNEEWNQTYGGNNWDFSFSVQQTIDGGYIIAGFTESFGAGFSDFWLIRLGSEVGVNDQLLPNASNQYYLYSNSPNPFNPTTTINYSIANEGNVELTIYNIKGQKVKTFVKEMKEPGHYHAIWDGTDQNCQPVSSGIYLYQLNINGHSEAINKMILLK